MHAKTQELCFALVKAQFNSIINGVASPQPKDSHNIPALAAVALIPCEMAFLAHKAAA